MKHFNQYPARPDQFTKQVDVGAEVVELHRILNAQTQRDESWEQTWRRTQMFPGARLASIAGR